MERSGCEDFYLLIERITFKDGIPLYLPTYCTIQCNFLVIVMFIHGEKCSTAPHFSAALVCCLLLTSVCMSEISCRLKKRIPSLPLPSTLRLQGRQTEAHI